MTHFLKLCYNVFILEKTRLMYECSEEFVLYLVGNCVNLCQFGRGFLLVLPTNYRC
jgi:hypothetical protein